MTESSEPQALATEPPASIERELFRSADLLVRAVVWPDEWRCYVTFDSYSDDPTLARPGFGEAHFRSRRISAIHVISRENRWYQHPELAQALAAAAREAARFATVIAYGSSMGGFAALHYGAAAGATIGLAISPQYSLRPGDPPHDRRWAADVARIAFQPFAAPALPIQTIVYDPHDRLDRTHAELFAARSPTVLVRIINAGHPVGSYLVETGMFEPLFAGVAAGTLTATTVPEFERELRSRRRMSGQLYYSLAVRIWRRQMAWGIALAERAAAVRPDSISYRSFLAFLLDKAGRHDAAAEQHRQALAMPAVTIHARINHIMHHAERGDGGEAVRLLGLLRADYPGHRLIGICAATIRRRRLKIGFARMVLATGLAPLVDRLTGGAWRPFLKRHGGL